MQKSDLSPDRWWREPTTLSRVWRGPDHQPVLREVRERGRITNDSTTWSFWRDDRWVRSPARTLRDALMQ